MKRTPAPPLDRFTFTLDDVVVEKQPPKKDLAAPLPDSWLLADEKYNPYHDQLGRFSTSGGASFVSFRPGTTSQFASATGRQSAPKVGDDPPPPSASTEAFETATSGETFYGAGKKWVQDNQKLYDTDPQFKAVADGVSVYTQGGFTPIREATAALVTGGKYSGGDINVPLGTVAKGWGSSYSGTFKGQRPKSSQVTLAESAAAINQTIRESRPLKAPIYRGMDINPREGRALTERLNGLKVGDSFDMHGVTSFTNSRRTAEQFTTGTAGGRGGFTEPRSTVLFEVKSGAKGFNVASMSPWKQQEVLTSGKFRVSEVRRTAGDGGTTQHHVVLEQTGVW